MKHILEKAIFSEKIVVKSQGSLPWCHEKEHY